MPKPTRSRLIEGKFVTVVEAARLTRYSVRHIQYLLKTGRVIGRKTGRDWLVDPDSVVTYKGQGYRPGRKPQGA